MTSYIMCIDFDVTLHDHCHLIVVIVIIHTMNVSLFTCVVKNMQN